VHCAVSQIEYLFSAANLNGDFFLRSYFDCKGAVPLAFLCNSYRIGFGVDYEDLMEAIDVSSDTLHFDRANETIALADSGAAAMWLLPNQDGTLGVEAYAADPNHDPNANPNPNKPKGTPELHPIHRIQEQCVTLKIDMRPKADS